MSYQEIKSKYPNKIPVIIRSSNVNMNKKKYLLDEYMTVGQFLYYLRRHITDENFNHSTGLFLYIDGKIPCPNNKISIYEKGFIEIDLRKENIFGC